MPSKYFYCTKTETNVVETVQYSLQWENLCVICGVRSQDMEKQLIHISFELHDNSGNKLQGRKYVLMKFINDNSKVNVVI